MPVALSIVWKMLKEEKSQENNEKTTIEGTMICLENLNTKTIWEV
mgnify:CR=1 FL=1